MSDAPFTQSDHDEAVEDFWRVPPRHGRGDRVVYRDPIWPSVVILLDLIGLIVIFVICLGALL